MALASLLLFFYVVQTAEATTGINKQINFQGKVTNTDGTNVANASYNFLFCVYTTASPVTPCTAGSNNDAVWKESKSITTADGIFQTNLGDTTAFASLIDFNTDNIYLGINFNSNGQMTPLVHFTTAPYALNADKVHGLSVTDTTGTLTIPNGKTIQFSDAFTTTGAFPLTLTATASTIATLPSGTITLADLGTSQTLTNKIIGSTGLTFTGATTDITTGTGEDLTLVANGAGIISLNDATTITGTTLINSTGTATTTIGNATGTFALTSSGGLNVTTGGALTGVASLDTIATSATALTFAGTGTIASTTTGLTLDSGSNTLTIASSDTALTASGIATMTLAPNVSITNTSGNLTLQPAGSGTIATVQIGAGGAGSTTPDYLALDVKSTTGDPAGGFEGALYYNTFDNVFRCYQGATWTNCIGAGGSSTLQTSYDTASGNTILTTTGRNIAYTLGEVATPTSFTVENQDTAGVSAERIFNSIASGTLTNGMLIEQTGAGTMTSGIQITETAGSIATGINIGNNVGTGIAIGTGVTTGISIASGGMTITAGALAINNATGITSNQATMVVNAGGTVDIQDILNADSVTTDTGGVSIANNQSYTGAGIVTLSSATASALTINSGTTGALSIGDDASNETINIATGAAIKTVTFGSSTTSSTTTIKSGTGGINLVPEDTAEGNVQIGTGGAGSTTPDLLALDAKSDAGDPATAIEGTMYYNQNSNKFRCYQNTTWTDCIGAGGGGPIGSDTQVAFNDAGTESGDAGFTFNKTTQTLGINGTDGEVLLNGITNEPSAPATGKMLLYSKSVAGRMMPKWIGPSGLDSIVQPMVAMNKVAWWNPPGNATTAPGVLGMAAMTVVSNGGTTMTTRSVATTRMFTRLKRAGVVSTAVAGTLGSLRQGSMQYTIGDGAGLGGFTYVSRFGSSDAATVTGAREFVGLSSATAAPTNVEPSTLTNSIGLCSGAADTNMKLCYGGSAPQTPIDLGVNFPANTLSVDMYELILYAPTNVNNVVNYRVTRLNTGDVATGTITAATAGTQLPASTTFLAARFWRTNNLTALAVGIDVASLYVETDY